jgi:hypothetical protein
MPPNARRPPERSKPAGAEVLSCHHADSSSFELNPPSIQGPAPKRRDRREYQRLFMRRKRAQSRAGQPIGAASANIATHKPSAQLTPSEPPALADRGSGLRGLWMSTCAADYTARHQCCDCHEGGIGSRRLKPWPAVS